ncbi:MAG: efflux RND transporter periplasmic adaptor subunit [Proteobacteria bacterium]|nr:MAG: efflux RND transporter periplasmic adaptor subunit [Pseudomonadota bacterium]
MPNAMKPLQLFLALTIAVVAASESLAGDAMPVSVVRSVRTTIAEEITLTGNLQARRLSRLSAEIDGFIETMKIDDGDRLSKGDVVLTLNTDLALIAIARSAAEIDEARAGHAEARRRYVELTELATHQHVPQTNVETARAEIDITRARLAQTHAEGRRVQALLERHTVRAPFDGVINKKLVEIGQWIETGTVLLELVEISFLRLEAPVPQFYFGRVKLGTRVTIRFDSLPDQQFEAAVTAVTPVSDNAARTFPIRIDIANRQGLLAPGMSAQVVVQIGDNASGPALIVPIDAVVRRPDGTETVWAIKIEDGVTTAEPREIKTGRIYRSNVEIVSGDLDAGTQVVVRGNEILRPGQTVVVAEDTPMDI